MRVSDVLRAVGRGSRAFVEAYGEIAILFFGAMRRIGKLPRYGSEFLAQFSYIGLRSFPLVIVTSIFMGLVLGVQLGAQANASTPVWIEGGVIVRAVLLEMGPIVTGLVLAGRVGSGVAAEIGAMKITEQVDALEIMGIDPVEFLVMPRLAAGMMALPVLIVAFDYIAIFAGFVSAHYTIGLSFPGFIRGARRTFVVTDVYVNLAKALITGTLIVLIGCHFGLKARQGARGVGRATTSAVIWSSVAIAVIDYVLSALVYYV